MLLRIGSIFSPGWQQLLNGSKTGTALKRTMSATAVIYCLLICLLATQTSRVAASTEDMDSAAVNVSHILNQFMVGYDKRVRPNYGGISVTVGVSLYILSIGDLSEKFMDFTFDMYFRQFWHDPRLAFDRRPGLDKLVVGAEYIKLIWVPDTFFVNEKIALFHQATTENQFLRNISLGFYIHSITQSLR